MKRKMTVQNRIRFLLLFFMCALIISGLTAIPLQWELKIIMPFLADGSLFGMLFPSLADWMERVNEGIQVGYAQYPFLAYGNDWLAFGHVAIALAFIGPLRDPVKNIWVVEFGMLACMLVIPWTFIFSFVRGIPLFWTMIDMSFGAFGIIPLWLVRRDIYSMVKKQHKDFS